MNIAIIGRTEMLLNTSKKLHSEGFTIKAIITCKSEGFYKAKEEDFESFAKEIGA